MLTSLNWIQFFNFIELLFDILNRTLALRVLMDFYLNLIYFFNSLNFKPQGIALKNLLDCSKFDLPKKFLKKRVVNINDFMHWRITLFCMIFFVTLTWIFKVSCVRSVVSRVVLKSAAVHWPSSWMYTAYDPTSPFCSLYLQIDKQISVLKHFLANLCFANE